MIVGTKPSREADKSTPGTEELTFYETLTTPKNPTPSVTKFPEPRPPGKSALPPARVRGGPELPGSDDSLSAEILYTLQVGSFQDQNAAKHLIDKLKQKGYPAYEVQAVLSDEVRYRVRVGHFSDKAMAKSLAERLEEREGLKSFIAYVNRQNGAAGSSSPLSE